MRLGETLDGRRISGMDYSGVEARRPHFGKRLVETGELLAEIGLRLFVGSREVRERALELECAMETDLVEELDRFVEAMIQIRKEIKDIEDGKAEKGNNIISHAPYTAEMLMADKWEFPFSRQEAGFPMKSDVQDKYFPHVTRVDDAYGDRNLVCKFSAE